MKKLVFILSFIVLSLFAVADGPNDLVVIIDPLVNPGGEVSEDFGVVFYDANGKQLKMEYTYDPVTGKITIKNATGLVFVVVTNKKTKESKTSKVFFTTGS